VSTVAPTVDMRDQAVEYSIECLVLAGEQGTEHSTFGFDNDPGGQLPHGWLQRNGVTISSLDLVPLDSSVVIAGCDAKTTSQLPVLRLGTDFADPNHWWGTQLGLPPTATLVVRPDQHIAERNT